MSISYNPYNWTVNKKTNNRISINQKDKNIFDVRLNIRTEVNREELIHLFELLALLKD